MAREAGTSAALTARTVLEEWLSLQREEGEGRVDDKVVKQQVTGRLLEGLVPALAPQLWRTVPYWGRGLRIAGFVDG